MKKFLLTLLSAIMTFACVFGFTACEPENSGNGEGNPTGDNATYSTAIKAVAQEFGEAIGGTAQSTAVSLAKTPNQNLGYVEVPAMLKETSASFLTMIYLGGLMYDIDEFNASTNAVRFGGNLLLGSDAEHCVAYDLYYTLFTKFDVENGTLELSFKQEISAPTDDLMMHIVANYDYEREVISKIVVSFDLSSQTQYFFLIEGETYQMLDDTNPEDADLVSAKQTHASKTTAFNNKTVTQWQTDVRAKFVQAQEYCNSITPYAGYIGIPE